MSNTSILDRALENDSSALVSFPKLSKVLDNCDLDNLYEQAKRPDFPFEVRRYGRRVYVTRESVERWLAGNE